MVWLFVGSLSGSGEETETRYCRPSEADSGARKVEMSATVTPAVAPGLSGPSWHTNVGRQDPALVSIDARTVSFGRLDPSKVTLLAVSLPSLVISKR
jgi:hypothetical protein